MNGYCNLAAVGLIVSSLWIGVPLDGQENKPKEPAPLPKGVVAVVNGQSITQEAYERFLYHDAGLQHLQDYIDRLLTREEAKRLVIVVPGDQVEKEVAEEFRRALKFFKDNLEVYKQFLKQRNLDFEEHKERVRQKIVDRLTLDQCILKTRDVTAGDVRLRFIERFGKDGISLFYRTILIAVNEPEGSPEWEIKRKKAEEVLEEAHATEDFAATVKKHSDDSSSKDLGGLLPLYFTGVYGPEFDKATEQIKRPGDISEVFKTSEGYQIIQLAERRETRLESVYETLFQQLKVQDPLPPERERYLQSLREKAKIEKISKK